MVFSFRTIRWKLISSSLLAIGVPLLIFAYYLASSLWWFYLQQLEQELKSKANVIADAVAPVLSPDTPDDPAQLKQIVDRWRRYSDMRVTVADRQGVIAAATLETDVGKPIEESRRPGMWDAIGGKENSTVWKSPNFGYEDTMYVNMPVRDEGRVIGVVRVAYSLAQIQHNIRRMRTSLLLMVAAYAALIVFLTVWLAGSIVRPVEQLNVSAQRLASGELGHRVHVDGTEEITQLAQTLNQMSQRLHQLEGLRRQYVSNVSHELRTPLAAIRGMAETLLEHGEADPTLRDRYLPRIIAQTERLARLASQLLDLAQIESGNLVHSFEPVSLPSVVDEALHSCGGTAAQKGVRIEVDVPPTLPPLPGDRDRLVQVFLNLTDNALRHTPEGGRVSLSARCVGEQITVTVADTGIGIDSEHLPHLFDRFYRVDKARSRGGGGTGLGLSIVRQIVEVHGGTITVESTPGEGTCFTLRFPLRGPGAAGGAALARASGTSNNAPPDPLASHTPGG